MVTGIIVGFVMTLLGLVMGYSMALTKKDSDETKAEERSERIL